MADNIPNSSPALSSSIKPQPGMAQCSVTKKWFPEDELVTFQGQLVSAEGKQILLDRLQTGSGPLGEFMRPSFLRRFGCIFLDGIILIPIILVVEFTAIMLASYTFASKISPATSNHRILSEMFGIFAIMYLSLGVTGIAYFSALHAAKGRTVGKMAGKLRVINMDGSSISWKKAVARTFVYIGWIFLFPLALLPGNFPLFGLSRLAIAVWGLTDIIMALVDTRMQRSLHDRICGTRVIRENV
jgi:uncharacterized RDD family membrane protein YckC